MSRKCPGMGKIAAAGLDQGQYAGADGSVCVMQIIVMIYAFVYMCVMNRNLVLI